MKKTYMSPLRVVAAQRSAVSEYFSKRGHSIIIIKKSI